MTPVSYQVDKRPFSVHSFIYKAKVGLKNPAGYSRIGSS